jgi:hypothetical protein
MAERGEFSSKSFKFSSAMIITSRRAKFTQAPSWRSSALRLAETQLRRTAAPRAMGWVGVDAAEDLSVVS